jgi:acyl-CoA thioester hydrolase
MPCEFRLTHRVEFNETDMAGIVHFSNFFRYMEKVESEFYRSLGFSVVMRQFDPPLGLPRVHAACEYFRPLRFEDVVELHLLITEKKRRSISYQVRFRRLEPGPAEDVAFGQVTAVCVSKAADGTMQAVPFPPALEAQLEAAAADRLPPSRRENNSAEKPA